MNIFKSYDIRGIFPEELSEETAYLIGQNFIKKTKAKKIVIAYDARLSSPALFKNLSQGIISQGSDVYNVGLAPTELMYFSVFNYDFQAGIMITASHNPKEYNGFKMIQKKNQKIEVIRGEQMKDSKELKTKQKGKLIKFNPFKDYLNHLLSFSENAKGKKIVVDAGNGTAGVILEKLKLDIIPLNFKPDGNFPKRSPNPLEKKALLPIKKKIKEKKADFGFLFDGDADRVFLVNKKGEMISSDACLLSLAQKFLAKKPETIVYNVFASRSVPEFVKKWKGKAIKSKVGFVNVRKAMMENKAILGGETSGHYCFKDNNYFDSGFMAFLMLLEIIQKKGKLIDLPYFKSSEINLKIKEKKAFIQKLKKTYKKEKQDTLDGIAVYAKKWWFCARPSQTEPLMRIIIEAETKDILEKKKKEILIIAKDPCFS